ncbi:hypothetical protein HNY73_009212 [Argiope bruennichi]|uniref:Uncharacterized protein n=1 Tax=Argiope bruennichi TaxID=94029 RepID=A0A8T0F8V1_ARGBR|nr:hypothetical protein HNY73_009212 [Argiope bruennichi]
MGINGSLHRRYYEFMECMRVMDVSGSLQWRYYEFMECMGVMDISGSLQWIYYEFMECMRVMGVNESFHRRYYEFMEFLSVMDVIMWCTALAVVRGQSIITVPFINPGVSAEPRQPDSLGNHAYPYGVNGATAGPINPNAAIGTAVGPGVPVDQVPLSYTVARYAAQAVATPLAYGVYALAEPAIRYGIELGSRAGLKLRYGANVLDNRLNRVEIKNGLVSTNPLVNTNGLANTDAVVNTDAVANTNGVYNRVAV